MKKIRSNNFLKHAFLCSVKKHLKTFRKCDVKKQKKMQNLQIANKINKYQNIIKDKDNKINQYKAEIMNFKRKFENKKLSHISPSTSPIAFDGKNLSPNSSLTILGEMNKNIRTPPKQRRYSSFFKLFSIGLLLISYPAYTYLRSQLPLPSRKLLMSNYGHSLGFEYQKLTDLSMIDEILNSYRKKENLSESDIIKVILAVDAISFKPLLKIDDNGTVIGTVKKEILSNSELLSLNNNFTAFEEFVKQRKHALITDAFVFQAQPILAVHSSFVVHVFPSTQGKGTDREVELLLKIKNILDSKNFNVISLAFDGDTIYQRLHRNLYDSYSSIIKNEPNYLNFSHISQLRLISDPLHLLKRGRYRLISNKVHTGLDNYTDIIDIDYLKKLFIYPSCIFSNSRITKMHDSLATKLFSFYSLKTIIESGNSSYLTFFLPLCLMNIALSETELNTIERINLLEISFYYCLILEDEIEKSKNTLPQKKTKNNSDVRLFDDNFLVELTNTLFSHLSILYCNNGTINLNRLSSNPLEHMIGIVRMRSRYSHIYSNAVKSLGKVQLLKEISKIVNPGEPINGRKSYYGQLIFNNMSNFKSVFILDPKEIAICIHMYLNLPITYNNIACSNMDELLYISHQIIEEFKLTLLSMYYRCHPNIRKEKLSTDEIIKFKGNIQNRLDNKNEVNKHF